MWMHRDVMSGFMAVVQLGIVSAGPMSAWVMEPNSTISPASSPSKSIGPMPSASSCQISCQQDRTCDAWMWQDQTHTTCKGAVNPEQKELCYHFFNVSGVTPSPCPGHISGWKAVFPTPTERQLEWMTGLDPVVGGFSQFMHFGINTFWVEGDKFDPKGTYHDCETNAKYCDEESCGDYAPCLSPKLFNPTDLDAEQWVLAAKTMGVQEICLTAQHEGGFALWPSNFTNYSVANSPWKGGQGDVLREFADACNKHGMGICYYLHPVCDHYSTKVANVTAEEFSLRQLGKIHEALTQYGPINRFWFDGKGKNGSSAGDRFPYGFDEEAHFQKVLNMIRTVSPQTLVTGYREWGGDIASSYQSLNLFDGGPKPNSTDMTEVGSPSATGSHFFPLEQVGICMQEGPDGNSDTSPTYWFYHPLVGHANASRIYDSWLHLVGHGETGMINIAADRTGQVPQSNVAVMAEAAKAIRDTFTTPLASTESVHSTCANPVTLKAPGTAFDYIETMEDLTMSQRIMNYSIQYRYSTNGAWSDLVPPVQSQKHKSKTSHGSLADRPAGADPRDSHVGFRRIDKPDLGVNTAMISEIRFNCIHSLGEDIYIKKFALYKAVLPWVRN